MSERVLAIERLGEGGRAWRGVEGTQVSVQKSVSELGQEWNWEWKGVSEKSEGWWAERE